MTMQSRRDLFQAHRLMTQRAALALLRGEPDVPDQPLRRINVATFVGVLVAVIAVAGFGIWGLLFHSAPSLSYVPGTLIMDKQTGTPYVFCGHKKQELCPTVNYASALLALQDPNPPNIQSVNQSSLTTRPHGPLIGIPGLPQDLPKAGLLIKGPWSVCTNAPNIGGVGIVHTTSVAGGIPTGGQPLGNQALLVSTSPNDNWVIWNNKRMSVQSDTLTVTFPGFQAITVPSVWLDSISQGQPFQAPFIQGFGQPVTGPDGSMVKVGQLYTVNALGSKQTFVTLQSGKVARVSPLQASLLLEQPGAASSKSLPASDLNGGHEASPLQPNGLPATRPEVSDASASGPFCVQYSGSGTQQVLTGSRMPSGGRPTGAPLGSDQIDDIDLPPGKGALVQETGNNVSYFLIADGRRFSLASNAVAGYLGYSTSQAVQLPPGVVDLIPAGPAFDPSEARNVVPTGG